MRPHFNLAQLKAFLAGHKIMKEDPLLRRQKIGSGFRGCGNPRLFLLDRHFRSEELCR